MHKSSRPIIHLVILSALISSGCTSLRDRYSIRIIKREQPAPPVANPHPTPAPPAVDPIPPPELMQWFERDGRTVLRIAAYLDPRGYAVITAHGHKHIDPASTDHDDWMRANNSRPPHRVVDGWAEWTLPWIQAEYARPALAHGHPTSRCDAQGCRRPAVGGSRDIGGMGVLPCRIVEGVQSQSRVAEAAMKRQIGRQAVLVAVTTTVQRGIQYLFNRRERREIRRDQKRAEPRRNEKEQP